jgi:hypothetical protein
MGTPVRITLGKPRFRVGYEYDEIRSLAPTPTIFRIEDDAEFEAAYLRHLDGLGVDRIGAALTGLSDRHGGRRLVLLCYEDVLAGQLCHRRMFARWWESKTGEIVPELDPAEYELRLFS